MDDTWVLTGQPGCGKTTAVIRITDWLTERGWRVDGLLATERRENGRRVGFDIADIDGSICEMLAAVDRDVGPRIGRYRVDTDALDRVCLRVLPRARREADVVVIDELGPMQYASGTFVEEVRTTIDSGVPTLATVRAADAVTRLEVVMSGDVPEPIVVTEEDRDTLPGRLANEIDADLRR